jgi:hypothetical protein
MNTVHVRFFPSISSNFVFVRSDGCVCDKDIEPLVGLEEVVNELGHRREFGEVEKLKLYRFEARVLLDLYRDIIGQ